MVADKSGHELLAVVLESELPAQVLGRPFEQYLFFDADITSSEVLISAFQKIAITCFGLDVEVDVFASSSRSLLARLGRNLDWPVEICRLGKVLRDAGDFGGLILLETKGRWVAYQYRPVDVGIFAIDSQGALNGIGAVKDDFFDCSDISGWLTQRTARDTQLVQGFGAEFLATLLENYQCLQVPGVRS